MLSTVEHLPELLIQDTATTHSDWAYSLAKSYLCKRHIADNSVL